MVDYLPAICKALGLNQGPEVKAEIISVKQKGSGKQHSGSCS